MKNKKISMFAKICVTAAVLAATTVMGFAYTTPFSYVSIDVNPSVEYSLNRFDRVVSVTAVNKDGERIVDRLEVKNEKITKAVQITIEILKAEGYLTDDEYAGIVIAVSNNNEDKAEGLKKDLEEELKENKDKEKNKKRVSDENPNKDIEDEALMETDDINIGIVVEAVGRDRVEEARKLNVTPGKLNLVQKLILSLDENDINDIDEEDLYEYLNMSVKEINKAIKENRKSLVDDEISDDDIDKSKEREKDTKDTNRVDNDDKDDYLDDNDEDDEKNDKKKVIKTKFEKIKKDNNKGK